MVESGGLENRCTFWYPGFESLPLRCMFLNYKVMREMGLVGEVMSLRPNCIQRRSPPATSISLFEPGHDSVTLMDKNVMLCFYVIDFEKIRAS